MGNIIAILETIIMAQDMNKIKLSFDSKEKFNSALDSITDKVYFTALKLSESGYCSKDESGFLFNIDGVEIELHLKHK